MPQHSKADDYSLLKVDEREDDEATDEFLSTRRLHSSHKKVFAGRIAFYISLFANVLLLSLLCYAAGVVSRCESPSSHFEISSIYCELFYIYLLLSLAN